MLSKNLKIFRKRKGLTQENVAEALNVVRQTISKWEKGISVPDANMLIKLAEILDVSVSELIGSDVTDEKNEDMIAVELARVVEQLASRNRRSKKVLKCVLIFLIILLLFFVFLCVINFAAMQYFKLGGSYKKNSSVNFNDGFKSIVRYECITILSVTARFFDYNESLYKKIIRSVIYI